MKQGVSQIWKILRRIRMPWLWVVLCVGVTVMETLAQVETMTLTGTIIDASQNTIRAMVLRDYIISIVAFGLMTVAREYINSRMKQTLNARMRNSLWDKIMHLPSRYYDADSADGLVTRVTVDASSAGNIVSSCITILVSIYSVAVVYRRLFRFHARLAAYALLVLPLTLAAGFLYGKLTYAAGYKRNASLAAGISYLAERVRSFRLIKSTGMEQAENREGKAQYRRMFGADMLNGVAISSFQIYLNLFNIIFILIAFLAGGRLAAAGEVTIGKLISFYTLSGMVTLKTSSLYSSIGGISETVGQLKKAALILDSEEEPIEGAPVPTDARDIVLDGVSFGYRPEKIILRDVSVTIPAGKVTAIIGTNGAGKSTVTKLLTRMYEPLTGAIRYGETDIREFALKQWRDCFSVVSQKNPLLMGTVRENIVYGLKREVSEEELIDVAKQANCYDFIMDKPGGFDAEVGMDGGNFSGGQRQCISIARAMLRDAPCLLLDEATSNLDTKCEQLVSAALGRLMKGKTAIVIAHRSGAVRNADYIIVMRDGGIEACGTPQELQNTNEYYRLFSQGSLDA